MDLPTTRPETIAEKPENQLEVGQILTLEIGAVAHGGHFIARHEGQVIFVRHAITGERARVQITSVASKISRGDAIEILTPSIHRVLAPCKFSGPGGCGGCDFQHIDLDYQRQMKASIIKEQFARVAKLEVEVEVLPVAPESGLDWRTRMDFAVSPDGRLGLYASRSTQVIEIDECLIAVSEMKIPQLAARKWNGDQRIEVSVSSNPDVVEVNVSRGGRSISGPTQLHEKVGAHTYQISPQSFWQSHKNAPVTLMTSAMAALDLRHGDHVCDLYAGVGLFTAEISKVVGDIGKVHLIESDRRAVGDAQKIFAAKKNVVIHAGFVEQKLPPISRVDAILLDPPRTGAGEMVVASMVRQKPRTIVYISCDPASLARDARFLIEAGYQLDEIVGFDLFPMTAHVESVARFSRKK
jgi:tRNA/tmRNA/rRNA uracil-C5-methylase (TrmA/RlmC/RlmD family)